jgi:stage II sporulation protein D
MVTGRDGADGRFVLSVPGKIRREFLGTLEVRAQGKELLAIVTMDRETAVASIVAAEGPPGAGIEARKAQAVVARSFLAAAHGRHDGFDFCDTTHCQFLREAPQPNSPVATAALQTNGLHLTYEGQTFPAMYSRSCGGHTHTLASLGLPTINYPYYSVACDLCLNHPERWHRTLDPVAQSPTAERARLALDRIHGWSALPSGTFTRTNTGIEGVGIGHGIGLCQRGAAALAEQGSDYRHLLAHFYPNTVTS